MRYLSALLVVAAIASPFSMFAQLSGCTNSGAINFNPNATADDGSCEVFETVIAYDATLSDDFEIGTGISNEHFAKVTHGPLEFGVKANRRWIEDLIPVNDNEYLIEPGYSPVSFNDPTPDVGKGKWDFLFSFNLGARTFDELIAEVIIDFDPIDNANQAAPYVLNFSEALSTFGESGSSFKQGSENLGFAYWTLVAGDVAQLFDALSDGVYDIGVRVRNQGETVLGEVSIRVIVGDPVDGCTDPEACNYDPLANVNDTSCFYAEPFRDCDGNCINDFNSNQVCDEEEVFGCTYVQAVNYNAEATADNGTCILECDLSDCERADLNNNGAVESADLLLFLEIFGQECD